MILGLRSQSLAPPQAICSRLLRRLRILTPQANSNWKRAARKKILAMKRELVGTGKLLACEAGVSIKPGVERGLASATPGSNCKNGAPARERGRQGVNV